jgi:hypothetical protein
MPPNFFTPAPLFFDPPPNLRSAPLCDEAPRLSSPAPLARVAFPAENS